MLCCRYWAVAVPTYVCVALVFAIILYVVYNFTVTPPLDSISTLTGIIHTDMMACTFDLALILLFR